VMIANGLIMRDLLSKFGTRLRMHAWLGLTLVASMLNLVSPVKGGAALRAVYLKKAHAVPYGVFAGVLGATLLGSMAASGALAAVALVLLGVPGGRTGWVMLGASSVLAGSLWLVLRLEPVLRRNAPQRWHRMIRMADAWRSVSTDTRLVLRVLGWCIAATVMHGVAFIFAFSLAGFEGNWLIPLAASAFARIGALIALTPAGLGIYEAFGTLSARLVGAEMGPAVIGVLMVRLASSFITVVGGAAFLPVIALRAGSDAAAGSRDRIHRENRID